MTSVTWLEDLALAELIRDHPGWVVAGDDPLSFPLFWSLEPPPLRASLGPESFWRRLGAGAVIRDITWDLAGPEQGWRTDRRLLFDLSAMDVTDRVAGLRPNLVRVAPGQAMPEGYGRIGSSSIGGRSENLGTALAQDLGRLLQELAGGTPSAIYDRLQRFAGAGGMVLGASTRGHRGPVLDLDPVWRREPQGVENLGALHESVNGRPLQLSIPRLGFDPVTLRIAGTCRLPEPPYAETPFGWQAVPVRGRGWAGQVQVPAGTGSIQVSLSAADIRVESIALVLPRPEGRVETSEIYDPLDIYEDSQAAKP